MLSASVIQHSSLRPHCFADVATSTRRVSNLRLHRQFGPRSQHCLCFETVRRACVSDRRAWGRLTRQLGLKYSYATAECRLSILFKANGGHSSCESKQAKCRGSADGVRPEPVALYTAAPLFQAARSISRSAAALLLALSVGFSQCLLPASASAFPTSSYGDLARMHYKRPPVSSALPNSEEAETIAELNRVHPASC